MINWNDPESWSCPIPGFQSVPDVFEALGRKMSPGGEWTGFERQVIRPDTIPKPADVFQPHDVQQYPVQYSPGATHPDAVDPPGIKPEDKIADYVAYNRHRAMAAELAGIASFGKHDVTFAEWCVAYDKSIIALRKWERAAAVREKVFVNMHRCAAAGRLVFHTFDWQNGTKTTLGRDVWQCTFEAARARFLRGAISPVYPNASAPTNPDSLKIFNNTFIFEIFADNLSVMETINSTQYEQAPTSPEALIELRAQAILQAANALAEASRPESSGSDPSMTAPPPLPKKRGPKPRYDWRSAEAALMELDGTEDILARIISGEVSQAVAENYMASWFSARGKEPAESSIRASVTAMIQHRRDSNAAKANNRAGNSN